MADSSPSKIASNLNSLTKNVGKLSVTVKELAVAQNEILGVISNINKRLLEHDDRFNELSADVSELKEYTYAGFDTMNARFDRLEDQFDRLAAEIGSGGYQH